MISQGPRPDGDSQLIDEVIAQYLQAESAGQAGDRQQWLDRFPDCAAGLAEFLDDRQQVNRLMEPIRLDRPHSAFAGRRLPANGEVGDTDAVQTVELCPQLPQLTTTRYAPLRFHARGGMGEIWLAKDERIGRLVAIKKLRAGREPQQMRFFAEAQITGQLEHPSVVPLHDIGMDDTGQPFYVMKFIHGRRLREAIADFHAQQSPVDWSEDLAFRRLLEILVNVCNVVAYAHHKGVVHRDIKPDNIMLGPYGEVLVVDWGLAKVMGQPDEERGSIVRLSGNGSTATQDGAIVGSPFYMSPEGAKGQPDAVDQSSDVYLLGATLYEILSGRPPRQAASSWELIELALNSRPVNPRTINSRVPRPLEAICLKAMSFDKRDRYETPLAFAADVERYLAGASTVAYEEPFWTRTGRWIRRHRRGLLQGLAALLVFVLAAYALRFYREAGLLQKREQARRDLTEYRQLVDQAQFFAANTDSISERFPYFEPRRALDAGNSALAIAAAWGPQADQLPLEEERAEVARSQYDLLLLLAQAKLHSASPNDSPQQALALLDRARSIATPSRGFYDLRSRCLASLGESQAAQLDRDRAATPTTALASQDHFLAGERLRLLDAGAGGRMVDEDRATIRREHLVSALAEYRQALALDPQHYWARYQLGRCLLALGRSPEAIEAFSGCVALRPDSPWAYTTRGLAHALAGRSDDALSDLNHAIRLDPDFQPAQLNRGIVHWLWHENDRAIADFTAALEADAEQLTEAAYYRSQVLFDDQRYAEARADLSAAIEAHPDFQLAYWYRAKAAFLLGDVAAGLSDLTTFVDLKQQHAATNSRANLHLQRGTALRKLAQQLPDAARSEPLQAAARELQTAIDAGPPSAAMWQQLGAVRELLSQNEDALAAYSEGLALSDETQLRNMRGWAYANQRNFKLAEADFSAALRLAANNPEAHTGRGFVLAELGQEDAARQEASSALLEADDNHLILHNVACVYGRLSQRSPTRKTEYENLAIAALARAAAISRQNPIGPDADELTLIQNERSFPEALKSRPEYQRLIAVRTSDKDR